MWEPCPLVHERRAISTYLLFRDDMDESYYHWESRSNNASFANPYRMVTMSVGNRTLAVVRYPANFGNAKRLGMMDVTTKHVILSISAFRGSGFDSAYYRPDDIINFDILVVRYPGLQNNEKLAFSIYFACNSPIRIEFPSSIKPFTNTSFARGVHLGSNTPSEPDERCKW